MPGAGQEMAVLERAARRGGPGTRGKEPQASAEPSDGCGTEGGGHGAEGEMEASRREGSRKGRRLLLAHAEAEEGKEQGGGRRNSSGKGAVDTAEDEMEEDLSVSALSEGSVVWAKIAGDPWWPGVIFPDWTSFE